MIRPLIGRQAKLALSLQTVTNGIPDCDSPAMVERFAKIATSSLTADDKKVFADTLEDSAAEYDSSVVGTFEPAGDIEFNAQEDGAFLDALILHYGNPTTSDIAQAGNFAAYKEHLFKATHAYRYGTVVEKIGAMHFIHWGARVNRLSIGVRKTQDRVVFAQANVWAYNSVVNKKTVDDPDAQPTPLTSAGTDTGLATASVSGSPYFAAVRAILKRAGSQWAGAQEFNFVSDAGLARVEDLDGFRGMDSYSTGKKVTADATLYFSTDAEYKAFTGVSSANAEVFGPGYDVIEEDLELIIPGNVRGNAPAIFQPALTIGLYRGVFVTPMEKTISKDAIMLKVNIQPQKKNSAGGIDSYVKVKNLIANAALIAAGDPLCAIPANAGSAYTAA